MGKFSSIVLSVTVTDDKIAAIEVVSQNETPNYWKKAVVLIDRIIEANNTDVDGITGATKSCNAIKTAVNKNQGKRAGILLGVSSQHHHSSGQYLQAYLFAPLTAIKNGRHFRVCRNFLYTDQYLII